MTHPVYIEPSKRLRFVPVTIPFGTPLSNAVYLQDYELKGFIMPDVWTAANLTLRGAQPIPAPAGSQNLSITGFGGLNFTPFKDVVDDGGTEVVITASSGKYIVLGAQVEKAAGLGAIIVRSGTSATPVNQGTDSIITLVVAASTK